MNQDEYLTSGQGLTQVKPELSRDEQLGFIDTLRETQNLGNQQITEQTRNLGSDVPYSHGGLGGSNYFLSRYQTPQVDSMVSDLKSAAQLSAMNTALKNYQDNLKDKYNQAYRAAKKRAAANNSNSNGKNAEGEVDITNTDTSSNVVTRGATMPNSQYNTTTITDPDGNIVIQYTDTATGNVVKQQKYSPSGALLDNGDKNDNDSGKFGWGGR